MPSAAYRVRIADAGASSVSGNVAVTLYIGDPAQTSDLVSPPMTSGPTVNPLKGTVVRQPAKFVTKSDDVLTTSGGRLNPHGRLCDIARSLDGAGYSVYFEGRVTHVAEERGRGAVTVEVSDDSYRRSRSRIFETTTSVQLHPPGMREAWQRRTAVGSANYTVAEVSGDAVRIKPNDEADAPSVLHIPVSLRESLAKDMLPGHEQDFSASNSSGNFTNLRFRYDSADRTVIAFKRVISATPGVIGPVGGLGTLSPEGNASGLLTDAWVYISGHTLTPGEVISGYFYWPSGAPVTDNVPQHIGGTDGIHPGDLLEDILDGDYGGEAEGYEKCIIFGVTSVPSRMLSFSIMCEGGAQWARIPLHMLFHEKPRGKWLSTDHAISDLQCWDCYGVDFSLACRFHDYHWELAEQELMPGGYVAADQLMRTNIYTHFWVKEVRRSDQTHRAHLSDVTGWWRIWCECETAVDANARRKLEQAERDIRAKQTGDGVGHHLAVAVVREKGSPTITASFRLYHFLLLNERMDDLDDLTEGPVMTTTLEEFFELYDEQLLPNFEWQRDKAERKKAAVAKAKARKQ